MKTWEMMQHSGKKFKRKSDGFVIEIAPDGTLYWDSGHRFLNINDEWEEVKEPVDFIEAVKSGKKIRSVTWMQNTELDLPNLLYDMSDFDEEEIRQLLLGKWYIED